MSNEKVPAKTLFFNILKEAGANNIFGNPGTTEFPFMDALPDHPEINYYLALHDAVAVGMAHGFTQESGKLSVINLHATPGITNALGNIYNAHKSGMPMLITAGQVANQVQLDEPPLWGPAVEIMRPITKWSYEITHPEELAKATRRALEIAMTPPYGPVFLSLPADVFDGEVENDSSVVRFTQLATNLEPTEQAVADAVEILREAKNPLMIVGDGVAKSEHHAGAVAFAEAIGAKVRSERIAPTAGFPTGHDQFFGSIGGDGDVIAKVINDADVLIIAGASRLAPIVPDPLWKLDPSIKVIQVDVDPWEIGKVHAHDVGMVADPGVTLGRIADEINKLPAEYQAEAAARREALLVKRQAIRDETEKVREAQKDAQPIAVSRVVTEIASRIGAEDSIFDESLTTTPVLNRFAEWNPGQYYGIKGTCLGWGLPAALGAQIAKGDDKQVIAVIGDGAMMYAPQTLWSAAHYNVPLTVVVVNNRSYKILKQGLRHYRNGEDKPYLHMDLNKPAIDYVSLANALGIEAQRIEESGNVVAGFDWAMEKEPRLLEILVNRELS